MKFNDMQGESVRIILTDGSEVTGVVDEITSAVDNEPNGACCFIGHTEILKSEIRAIEKI